VIFQEVWGSQLALAQQQQEKLEKAERKRAAAAAAAASKKHEKLALAALQRTALRRTRQGG